MSSRILPRWQTAQMVEYKYLKNQVLYEKAEKVFADIFKCSLKWIELKFLLLMSFNTDAWNVDFMRTH